MPVSKKQQACVNKYNSAHYGRISVMLKKDGDCTVEQVRAHAAARGESVNGFITRAIAEAMEREKEQPDK